MLTPVFCLQDSELPSCKTRVHDLRAWLDGEGIKYDPTFNKKKLWKLCQREIGNRKRFLEDIVRKSGHEVLWLPPYHAHFNPIELIWGLVKRYLRDHIGRFNDYSEDMMIAILKEAMDAITPTVWNNTVEKIERRILHACERELPPDDPEQENFRMVINLQDDSDSDEEDVDDPQPLSRLQLFPQTAGNVCTLLIGVFRRK